jgi:phosphatidylglycerophosphate synthase
MLGFAGQLDQALTQNTAVETALIAAPSRADELVFGRTVLERLVLLCERAGVTRIFVSVPAGKRDALKASLARIAAAGSVTLVSSLDEVASGQHGIARDTPCIALRGNLVMSGRQLAELISSYVAEPARVARLSSADAGRAGEILVGPLGALLTRPNDAAPEAAGPLPYALDGRNGDRGEAGLRLARTLRDETKHKDALIARHLDRRVSWRISYLLARTPVTANQVTIANTLLGLACAWMFAQPGYWWRLAGSVLFVLSVTLDGVDGEVARLKMGESKFGGQLDVATDNIVNVAIFLGLYIGCYRESGDVVYLYLLSALLGGFALCGLATWSAFRVTGHDAERWVGAVHRWSGRDFAYILLALALAGGLEYFAWGAAFGTYLFALGLWLLTIRHVRRSASRATRRGVAAEGV